mmetsp:Transcript_1118/g.1646  ORF Transcript_1118/g.1646 Transcript_1118/m.1646 type:complete len:681 (-) Transcript_1118:88-2130(-)
MTRRHVHCIALILINFDVSLSFINIHGCHRSEKWPPKTNSYLSKGSHSFSRSSDGKDEESDDDDDYLDVDTSKFNPPKSFYGLNRGRSAPGQRKAMSTKASSSATVHVCTKCGSEFVKWMGRCPTCREWNTLQEFKVARSSESTSKPRPSFTSSSESGSWLGSNDYSFENRPLRVTDIYETVESNKNAESSKKNGARLLVPDDDEINTVLGGGIMDGSLTLLGGDPGVGKSTLCLQIAGAIASLATPSVGIGMGLTDSTGIGPVWYVSGEESSEQIASRALRLGIRESELWLLCETHADVLCNQVINSYHLPFGQDADDVNTLPRGQSSPPSLIIIDSIQTMVCDAGGASSAGGVTQVRECVAIFLRLAKSTGIPIFLVGHVTKSGDVAGPRTVEHMVDCVLYFEGGDHRTVGGVNLRMLRAAKNRFGSADEVGVYEMTSGRLLPVSDPSSLFLSDHLDTEDSEGCAITLILEGLRAMTVEIQALVTPNNEGAGKRTVDGIAYSRLQLLIGVLRKRCNMYFAKQDVYINVVGNLRLDKGEGSTSDLAVSLALVSSLLGIPVRSDTAFVGEVGLLGELRTVPFIEKRILEARRMGFSRIVSSRDKKSRRTTGKPKFSKSQGIDWIQCDNLLDALNEGLVRSLPKKGTPRRKFQDSTQSPRSVPELMLDEVILDDDDYEDFA